MVQGASRCLRCYMWALRVSSQQTNIAEGGPPSDLGPKSTLVVIEKSDVEPKTAKSGPVLHMTFYQKEVIANETYFGAFQGPLLPVTGNNMTAVKSMAGPKSAVDIRLCSWNLRYDSQPDNITVDQTIASLPDPLQSPSYYTNPKERPWSTRRIHVASELLQQGVDVVGFQEALTRQVNDLQQLLGDDWGWVGVGRNDGNKAGEFSPVFYKKSIFKVLSWDTFWLSDTPFRPSKYPGAGSYRICTAVRFQAIHSNATFLLLNTHLDDRSDAQRRLGASLLLHRANYEASQTNIPVLITGDFNSPQTGSDSGAYQIITGAVPPVDVNSDFRVKYPIPPNPSPFTTIDLKGVTPRQNISGHYATFTGFSTPEKFSSYTRIDFILGGSNGGWQSKSYKVGNSLYDDGVWASDHRPVISRVIIKK